MKHKIDNQQDYNLTENQKQVLLTGVFGDGCITNKVKGCSYSINCYNYKLWSSETIQKWSKLEAQLKSEGLTVTPRKFTNMLGKI